MKYGNGVFCATIMCLFVNMQLFSMHRVDDKPCLLSLLPLDILDYIASFLEWESYKAFVERTGIIKEIPFNDSHIMYFDQMIKECNTKEIVPAFSPDERKMIFTAIYCEHCKLAEVVVVDFDKEGYERMLLKETLYNVWAKYGTVSTKAQSVATIEKKEHRDAIGNILNYSNVVVVRNIIDGESDKQGKIFDHEVKEYAIPGYIRPSIIAFNFQDTHLILHGTSKNSNNKVHHLYVLKDDEIHYSENNTDAKESQFLEYFKHKWVCKTIPGLPLK